VSLLIGARLDVHSSIVLVSIPQHTLFGVLQPSLLEPRLPPLRPEAYETTSSKTIPAWCAHRHISPAWQQCRVSNIWGFRDY
jgi:hypothetical protein